jgi:hypothetical protein
MRPATYRDSSRAQGECSTSVGTRIDGRTSLTSTSRAMRATAAAAPGLAPVRSIFPSHATNAGLSAREGAACRTCSSTYSGSPHRSRIAVRCAFHSSSVGANG